MPRNSLVRAVFAALLVTVFVPADALGAKPVQQFHDHFTDSFSADICGISVDAKLTVTDNFFIYADGSVKDTSSVRQTFTNPLNGRSVSLSAAGQFFGSAGVVNEAASTITFANTFKGLPLASWWPSGENATAVTALVWPSRVAVSLPLAASRTRTV